MVEVQLEQYWNPSGLQIRINITKNPVTTVIFMTNLPFNYIVEIRHGGICTTDSC
jgi:hypothetical protein